MIGRWWYIIGILVAGAFASGAVEAASMATDLSDHEIAITSNFSGTDLLLFGARGEHAPSDDFDVIAVIHGPEVPMKIWRKQRVAGIWVNSTPVTFENVPGYYAVASNRPLDAITTPEYLRSQNIGFDNLVLISIEDVPVDEKVELRRAIIGNRQAAGLYIRSEDAVTFPAGALFRSDLHFPASVPTGDYQVIVRLFRDGIEVDRTSTVLTVGKKGLEQQLYSLAKNQSLAYGLGAVLLAMAAGWLAAAVFRQK